MDDTVLHRFNAPITSTLRDELLGQTVSSQSMQQPVRRSDGSTIDLSTLDDLMTTIHPRFYDDDWTADRTLSDRWLAPRLHFALRLTRAQAGERTLWAWLAIRYSAYVTWRWADTDDVVNDDRWNGPVHKQALMRLWWGAELFRDGPDYSPVERAFIRQDLPNSYLHRPIVRCRSLALAIVDVLAPASGETPRTSDEVNDLARVLNLAVAGCPPELETEFQQDDHSAYDIWLRQPPAKPETWEHRPTGPDASDTTATSLTGGRSIAERGWAYAELAKGDHRPHAGTS